MLGTPTPDPSGSTNRFLVARPQVSARPNTTSGLYGLGSFPLHTDYAYLDLPPRYILLRSHFGKSSTATKLLNPLNSLGGMWVDLLKRATWRINSGVHSRAGTMRIPRTEHGFRWDPHLMNPLNEHAKSALYELKQSLLSSASIQFHSWTDSHTALLIDNWHALHGRCNATEATYRCMERVFLKEIYCV